MDINFIAAYVDESEQQYFGENGEYTSLMDKRKREIEKFWGMPGQIRVNGQHGATLNDRDKVAHVLYNYFTGLPTLEAAHAYADYLLSINAAMSTLPESPFFSIDGFATSGDVIVIGDGLVQMVSEAGVAQDIVWTGILAHEWAHQIQFDNYAGWYPGGAAEDPAESTRYTELEADFMAAYYMTHKRGATYNWKRVEQFFTLFFQIGDCGFESSGHHGTPLQRMAAAQLGYETANQAQKQGHIMSPQELHGIFVASIDNVL
ncbi:neutral zinc metallopeptidase [Pontibacter harenae]|uniref:neutral zinc metallopeptidase n=1 Tax=Pontibacter harenae TaxID=2894083 RepID=UPI001E5EE424|nr:neutral zinc metallopeptidase [Pontibacter harenae]MCC9169211.1 neutral zinc metallopeptidase [Pontibacter harenae]